jgi:3-deoxy-7-phosphoheptulonate synthase
MCLTLDSFNPDERTPDPERLLRYSFNFVAYLPVEWLLNPCSAYFHSTATLNHIRSLLTSGFASLHHPRDWSLLHVRSQSLRWVEKQVNIRVTLLTFVGLDRDEYEAISEGLSDALDLTRTIGLASGREAQSYERGGGRGVLGEADLYTRYPHFVHEYQKVFKLVRQP